MLFFNINNVTALKSLFCLEYYKNNKENITTRVLTRIIIRLCLNNKITKKECNIIMKKFKEYIKIIRNNQ